MGWHGQGVQRREGRASWKSLITVSLSKHKNTLASWGRLGSAMQHIKGQRKWATRTVKLLCLAHISLFTEMTQSNWGMPKSARTTGVAWYICPRNCFRGLTAWECRLDQCLGSCCLLGELQYCFNWLSVIWEINITTRTLLNSQGLKHFSFWKKSEALQEVEHMDSTRKCGKRWLSLRGLWGKTRLALG